MSANEDGLLSSCTAAGLDIADVMAGEAVKGGDAAFAARERAGAAEGGAALHARTQGAGEAAEHAGAESSAAAAPAPPLFCADMAGATGWAGGKTCDQLGGFCHQPGVRADCPATCKVPSAECVLGGGIDLFGGGTNPPPGGDGKPYRPAGTPPTLAIVDQYKDREPRTAVQSQCS